MASDRVRKKWDQCEASETKWPVSVALQTPKVALACTMCRELGDELTEAIPPS